MKVVLLKTVRNVGRIGETVEVKEGFAMNFLLPQKLAAKATVDELKKVAQIKAKHALKQEESQHFAEEATALLKNCPPLVFTEKVTAKGTLYGAINEQRIADKIKEVAQVDLPVKMIVMEHIKTLGEHKVEIHLNDKLIIPVAISVKNA